MARVMVRVRVRVSFSVEFRNLHNYFSDKCEVTLWTNDL